MQRTLESLEIQERFLALMSRDAHAMSFPAPVSEISGTSPLVDKTLRAGLPLHASGSHLLRTARYRRSNLSISAPAPRARTMYINAAAALPTLSKGEAAQMDAITPSASANSTAVGRGEATHMRGRSSKAKFESIAEEIDGLPAQGDVARIQDVPSPDGLDARYLSPTSAGTPPPRMQPSSFTTRASLDSLLQKNAAQSAKSARASASSPSPSAATVLSSPSSFFSSFFSSGRSQATSAATSIDSTPTTGANTRRKAASVSPPSSPTIPTNEVPELVSSDPTASPSRLSAQALLASLAGSKASVATAHLAVAPTKQAIEQTAQAGSPFSTISQTYTARSGLSSQDREQLFAGPPSPSPSGPSPSALASAQLSLVHSASPHLTVANRKTSRPAIKEAQLDAAVAATAAAAEPAGHRASSSTSAILQQKRPKHRASLSESLLRASIGGASGAGHRLSGSVGLSKDNSIAQGWVSRVPLQRNSEAATTGDDEPGRSSRSRELSAPA